MLWHGSICLKQMNCREFFQSSCVRHVGVRVATLHKTTTFNQLASIWTRKSANFFWVLLLKLLQNYYFPFRRVCIQDANVCIECEQNQYLPQKSAQTRQLHWLEDRKAIDEISSQPAHHKSKRFTKYKPTVKKKMHTINSFQTLLRTAQVSWMQQANTTVFLNWFTASNLEMKATF